ncbi:MAG: CDP-alcohol phosphatidyltransferase family protein [Actinomycetota bacterium]|nr:CDP-alcohol phosphatidyltransferase family protein [Actinomycetota bacterium]
MLNAKIRTVWDKAMRPTGRTLHRWGIGANAITLFGVAVTGVTAYLIIEGRLVAAGLVAIVAALADTVDGAVAKAAGVASKWGALLDSTADRLSDALFFIPVAWLYGVSPDAAQADDRWVAALALVTLVVSYLVSYIKARAEGLGYDCNVGIVERAERLILMIIALVFYDIMPLVLGILAALSLVTVVQRLVHVRRQARGDV